MHQIFSDPQKLKSHAEAISVMLEENNFSGVDIDYEGKDVADRDLFTGFLQTLRQRLEPEEKEDQLYRGSEKPGQPTVQLDGSASYEFRQ